LPTMPVKVLAAGIGVCLCGSSAWEGVEGVVELSGVFGLTRVSG